MKPTIILITYTALIAGCLDGIAAVVFLANMNFSTVWKFVASGFFGIKAFSGGNEMVVYGLLFHFMIAFFWTIVYYLLLRNISFFKRNIIIGGLFYGVIIWSVMNLVVLPFTNVPPNPLTVAGIVKGMVILMLCVGLPISFLIQKENRLGN
jgi:hypothetical protein